MLHHIVFEVSDLEQASSFFDALLSPLGWRRHENGPDAIGYGISRPLLFIAPGSGVGGASAMISLGAPGIAAVKAAWEAGIAAGGTGVAGPGEASGPGSGSYSAFLRDLDGHEIEITVGGD